MSQITYRSEMDDLLVKLRHAFLEAVPAAYNDDRLGEMIGSPYSVVYHVTQHFAARPKADWSRAPAWAQWWACDPNGWGHWFEEEPLLSLTITYCGWVPKTINGVQIGAELWAGEIEIPLGIDWRTLIEPRPQEVSK